MRGRWVAVALAGVALIDAPPVVVPAAASTDALPSMVLRAVEAENQQRVDDGTPVGAGGLHYSAQRTVLVSTESVRVVGVTAVVRATVESTLDFCCVEGAPPYTAGVVPYTGTFSYRDGAWVLTGLRAHYFQ